MSEETPEVPSIWDPLDEIFASIDTDEEFDWDAIIGEPPEWYYPLVGRIAVAMGGLERSMAQTALQLVRWPAGPGVEQAFWLQSTARLQTLLAAAKGLMPAFDIMIKELRGAASQRNEVVHVATAWHDWDEPGELSGWHYEHPRSGARVYLDDPTTKPALERVLKTISELDQRVWDLYRTLVEPASEAPEP